MLGLESSLARSLITLSANVLTRRTLMRTALWTGTTLLVLTTLLTGTGCLKSEVEDQTTTGSTGAGAANPTGGGGGTTPVNPYEGVAMRFDAIPEEPSESGTTVTTGGGGPSGDTLVVAFGKNVPFACGKSPFLSGNCPSWDVIFNLPLELQKPGIVSLSDPRLNGFMSVTAQNAGAPEGDCYFGGGSFVDGQVEILSIGNGELRFKLSGTSTFDFDANGEHVVQLCSEFSPPGSNAIAYRNDAIPPVGPTPSGSSVGTTSGGGPDVDDLLLVITSPNGAKTLACSTSPFQTNCTKDNWSIFVRLPSAYQKPGTYPLAELNANFSETIAGPSPETCGGGGGSFFEGSLEVVAIDADTLDVKLVGADVVSGDEVNGAYTMAICE